MSKAPRLAALALLPLLLLAGCSTYSKVREIPRTSALAATPEQRALVLREERLKAQPLAQLGGYLDAADAARLKLAANPADKQARADYNFAVARVVDLVGTGKLAAWDRSTACPSAARGAWNVELESPLKQQGVRASEFTFTPADRYKFKGTAVKERVVKDGLGAPVVVTGKDLDYLKLDRFAQGKHIYYGLTAIVRFDGKKAVVSFADPLAVETVRLDRATYPLAADFTSPLALALAELEPKKTELRAFFKPQEFEEKGRLSRLQPYDPDKIPVLFVHGLSNSPAIWVPTISYLRGDAAIRKNYQFWFFAYPTGLPYPLAAAELRRQLALIRKQYPGQKDAVVVGHSMGGMISRLLITDSGTKLWNTLFNVPPDKIPLSPESRETLADSLVFRPVPKISRVIFAAASHRGSYLASNFFGRLGSSIIGNAVTDRNVYTEAFPYARADVPARRLGRLPNSIDLLKPDNFFVTAVDTLPLARGVPYHSLMGDRGKGGTLGRTPPPQSSDGIVPYWSSHMPGARSEKIVPSGHWVQLHPDGMAELRRILLAHPSE